jgi:hypothetical protein
VSGNAVQFEVKAASPSPLTYQWLLNGSNIPGATSASLVIPNAQPAHAGVYFVIVSNDGGVIASEAAPVVVLRDSHLVGVLIPARPDRIRRQRANPVCHNFRSADGAAKTRRNAKKRQRLCASCAFLRPCLACAVTRLEPEPNRLRGLGVFDEIGALLRRAEVRQRGFGVGGRLPDPDS